jgi:hypothetical protein
MCGGREGGPGGTNCVGSAKSLKRHFEFGKHNICACVLWTDGKSKKKKKKNTQNEIDIIDDTDKQSKK